jgi:hypothetical protein
VQAASNLEINIPPDYKQVLAGQDVLFTIQLSDFEPGRKDVILGYWISNSNRDKISEQKETVAIESRAEFVKSINVPENAKQGRYTISVKVTSLERREVVGGNSFEVIGGNTIYYTFIVILILITAIYLIFLKRFLLLFKKISLKIKIKNIIKKRL